MLSWPGDSRSELSACRGGSLDLPDQGLSQIKVGWICRIKGLWRCLAVFPWNAEFRVICHWPATYAKTKSLYSSR